MQIGAHVSIAGGVDNAVDNQREVGGTCGQLFTTSPRVWAHPDIGDAEATAFREGTATHLEGPWVIHAAYLVNLATPDDELRERSIANLQADLAAAARLGVPYVNVHLGAHTGAGVDAGLANAATAIDALAVPDGVTLLVETDAGAGTKLGGAFDHLAAVEDRTTTDLAFCLDTAHTHVAGHDLGTPAAVDATLAAFDAAVGLDQLAVVHLNDSKHAVGTHKDEHAHLGDGTIGDDAIAAILTHDALRDRPFVLETPTEDGRSFAWNIEHARALRA
ncbi:MAG: deoxyribonuclease IV [Halobacteriaceae archaeon]